MVPRRSIVSALLCSVLLLSGLAQVVKARDEQHFLEYSEDSFKVVFISGNLTAAVTHDWPRVVFQHSTDPFSPTFEVGISRFYLFNDSNGDGQFAMSELRYVAYLDENHVDWNVTNVEFHNYTSGGEYALFRMNTTLALYEGLTNETVAVSDWANITFCFRISERSVTYTNPIGSYVVSGKTELSLNFSLDIREPVNLSGLAMEQRLQGGGSTYMFLLKEQDSNSQLVSRPVSARVDESVYGLNFTNRFNATSLPEQEISYAKSDGTVQAFYRWDSVPMMSSDAAPWQVPVNCSYFTTGTGLMLYSAYFISNRSGTIFQDASLGIDESGFIGSVSNWFKDNVNAFLVLSGAIAVVAVLSVYALRIHRRNNRSSNPGEDLQGKKES